MILGFHEGKCFSFQEPADVHVCLYLFFFIKKIYLFEM